MAFVFDIDFEDLREDEHAKLAQGLSGIGQAISRHQDRKLEHELARKEDARRDRELDQEIKESERTAKREEVRLRLEIGRERLNDELARAAEQRDQQKHGQAMQGGRLALDSDRLSLLEQYEGYIDRARAIGEQAQADVEMHLAAIDEMPDEIRNKALEVVDRALKTKDAGARDKMLAAARQTAFQAQDRLRRDALLTKIGDKRNRQAYGPETAGAQPEPGAQGPPGAPGQGGASTPLKEELDSLIEDIQAGEIPLAELEKRERNLRLANAETNKKAIVKQVRMGKMDAMIATAAQQGIPDLVIEAFSIARGLVEAEEDSGKSLDDLVDTALKAHFDKQADIEKAVLESGGVEELMRFRSLQSGQGGLGARGSATNFDQMVLDALGHGEKTGATAVPTDEGAEPRPAPGAAAGNGKVPVEGAEGGEEQPAAPTDRASRVAALDSEERQIKEDLILLEGSGEAARAAGKTERLIRLRKERELEASGKMDKVRDTGAELTAAEAELARVFREAPVAGGSFETNFPEDAEQRKKALDKALKAYEQAHDAATKAAKEAGERAPKKAAVARSAKKRLGG